MAGLGVRYCVLCVALQGSIFKALLYNCQNALGVLISLKSMCTLALNNAVETLHGHINSVLFFSLNKYSTYLFKARTTHQKCPNNARVQ